MPAPIATNEIKNMQVSDAGMLLRSTLQASKILIQLRGMIPLTRGKDEVDVRQWLQRRDVIEDLDEELFEHVAHSFVALMLEHDKKNAVMGKVVASTKKSDKKLPAKRGRGGSAAGRGRGRRRPREESVDDDNDDEEVPEVEAAPGALRIDDNDYVISKLTAHHREFLPHLYPLVFGALVSPDRRPHAMLDYPLAAIVHTGRDVKTVKLVLKKMMARMHKLRVERAALFGYTSETAPYMPCRLLLVLWGNKFHPKTGSSYNPVRLAIAELNALERASGNNITTEMYSVTELNCDVAAHEDAGQYTVINDPSSVRELKTIKPHQYAYIRENDPQAKLRDLRIGQVVRIDRKDFDLGGKSHDYRVVVSHDHVLEAGADAPGIDDDE